MKKNSFLRATCIFSLTLGSLFAQPIEKNELKSYSLGIRGLHLYDLPGVQREMQGLNGEYTNFDLGLEIYLEKQFTPLFALQAGFRSASISGANDVEYYSNRFSQGFVDAVLILSNLDPKRIGSRWHFYLKGGLGLGQFEADRYLVFDESANGSENEGFWSARLGAGIQYRLTNALRAELFSSYNAVFHSGFDGFTPDNTNMNYLSSGLGIAYTFGKKDKKPMYSINYFGEEYFNPPHLAQQEVAEEEQSNVDKEVAQAARDSAQTAGIAALERQVSSLQARLNRQDKILEKRNEHTAVSNPDLTVYFAFDSAVLDADAQKQLAQAFRGQNDRSLRIRGHADKSGDPVYNQQLKIRRAEAVRDFLVQRLGFDAEKLQVEAAAENEDGFLGRRVVVGMAL